MLTTTKRPKLPLTPNHRKPRALCVRCKTVGPIVGRGLCGKCWHTMNRAGTLADWPTQKRGSTGLVADNRARPATAAGRTVTLSLPPAGVALWEMLEAAARREWRTPELQLCAMLAAVKTLGEAQDVTP